jgi:restriction endonuclease S subunit
MLLGTVPIEDIAKNNYSLNYSEYIKKDDDVFASDVNVMTLGEVCNFKNGKGIKKDTLVEGEYPVIGGGQKPMGFHNKYNADENTILCSSSGAYAGFISKYVKKVWASDCFSIIPKNDSINNTYLYYFLKSIQDKIYKLQTGTAQPHIYSKNLQNIKIPIPPIALQREAVAQLDFIYKCIKSSEDKIAELQQLNKFCISNQKNFGKNEANPIGEICNINYGTRIIRRSATTGEYLVYGSGRAMFSTTTYNREGYNILIGRFALSAECVRIISEKIFLNDSGLTIIPKDSETILHKYIGYYLFNNQNIIYDCARGTAQKNLDMDKFKSLRIQIPSLDRQKEIVEYCEYNDALILQLHKEIEQNKDIALKFLTQIINSGITNFECDDIEEHDGDESKDGDEGDEEHDEDEE